MPLDVQTPATKGPLVFLNYDQAELDAAYDQIVYAPNREQIAERNEVNSDLARTRIGEPRKLAYGPSEFEYIDLYRTTVPNAPVLVFIHGGAWRFTGTARYGFAAEPIVNAGAHFAAVQFTGVEAAGGSLMPMIEHVRRAVAWIYQNAASFGGDPGRVYLAGHSSGAHLAGATLITDWEAYGVPADLIRGALCCSGMYELARVRLSKRSAYVAFDDAMVEALSTIRYIDKIAMPVTVAYGTCETPEFQRQGQEFADALAASGKLAQLIVGRGYNHFELIETIGNPYGLIGQAALEMLQLEPFAAAKR